MKTLTPVAPTATSPVSNRDAVAVAFFGTWMVTGLFLDGWAHQANKPETFFSPWHGVLYSGFGAAVAFFAVIGFLDNRRGVQPAATDRLLSLGLAMFVAGGMTDFVWHEIFGIEVDIEALLSPTHLMLMTGGILMLSSPVRAAWRGAGERVSWAVLVCVTLIVAVASFFTMFLSPFVVATADVAVDESGWEAPQIHGVASLLVANVLLVGVMLLVRTRFTTPFGAYLLLFAGVATALSGLRGFERFPLVLAAAAAGLVADLLARRSARTAAMVVPLVLWTAWYGVFHLTWGIAWAAEIWTGSVVLAVLSGLGLSLLSSPAHR